jgi:hypothetical protein
MATHLRELSQQRPDDALKLVIALMALSVFAIGMAFYTQAQTSSQYQSTHFCKPEDPVYQAIQSRHEDWKQFFSVLLSPQPLDPPRLSFTVENGVYTVSAEQWQNLQKPPVFFVVAQRGLGQGRYGSMGYFYSPENVPSLGSRYQITRLDGDVYCYQFNS